MVIVVIPVIAVMVVRVVIMVAVAAVITLPPLLTVAYNQDGEERRFERADVPLCIANNTANRAANRVATHAAATRHNLAATTHHNLRRHRSVQGRQVGRQQKCLRASQKCPNVASVE